MENIDIAYKTVDVFVETSAFAKALKTSLPMEVGQMKRYESIRSCISKDRPSVHLAFLESQEAGIAKAAIHAKKYVELIAPILRERIIGAFRFTEGNKLMKFVTPNNGEVRFWFDVTADGNITIHHSLEENENDEVIAE